MLNDDMLTWEWCVWASYGNRHQLLGLERENCYSLVGVKKKTLNVQRVMDS